ncbi:hypothetical protein QJS10_CPB13g00837 [Acorus calamus]|uniref:Pectinesterase inhibitor domain-containing protein n=1 Tax=Acorus calamus TaxID=4465 RepID=A0AAV9DJ45_ACOCL|nr:hypothetical protein QJS10_CPB13g00837 [Acorus calamus]
MSNATNTSSYLSNTTSSSSDPALKSCSARYAEACAALHGALDALAVEMYDYAYLQASAAGECARTCREAFGRRRPKVAYPVELARREEGLARLCTIALQIINQLVV